MHLMRCTPHRMHACTLAAGRRRATEEASRREVGPRRVESSRAASAHAPPIRAVCTLLARAARRARALANMSEPSIFSLYVIHWRGEWKSELFFSRMSLRVPTEPVHRPRAPLPPCPHRACKPNLLPLLPLPSKNLSPPPPSLPSFFPAAENFPTRHRRLDSDEAREEGEEARVIPNTESDGGAIDKSSEISFLGRARTSCLGLRALPAVNSRETAPRERSLADACVSGYVAPRRAVFTACPILELGGAKEGTGQGEGGGRAALFSSFPSPPVSLSRRLAPLPTDAVGGRPSPPLGCTTLHDFFTTDESYSRDILF